MKTLTTFLLAVLCLFSSHTFAQKGSIEKLLKKNDFEWKSGFVSPEDFDNEKGLNTETEGEYLTFDPEGSMVTPTFALSLVKKFNFTPMSLKEALQFRNPQDRHYAGMYSGKTTVFLGSSILVGEKAYYPILLWPKEASKGMILMTADPFCCTEVNIVVKN